MKRSTEFDADVGWRLFDLQRYLSLIDTLYPRFLNQIDRDPDSPTYGSCDRLFWMCRQHDFDSGVLQQAPLVLAGLWKLAVQGTALGGEHIDPGHRSYWRELALGVAQRNAGLLEKNGLLDEYYPGEQSLPGTVFAAYATLKSADIFGFDEIVSHPGLRKTAERLLARHASPAANQDTAAAAYLALYAKLNHWQSDRCTDVVGNLLAGIPGAAPFSEYGGGDLGYATVSLNYLAHMLEDRSHDVHAHILELAGFIADFVSPKGGIGGEYASRSTTYFLPYGLVTAARQSEALAAVLGRLDVRSCFERLDDRYLMHYCFPSLVMGAASLAAAPLPPAAPPASGIPSEWRVSDHANRGLLSIRNDRSAVFIGLNKGGTFQAETGEETYIDCGYRIRRGGRVYATCVVDEDCQAEVHSTPDGSTAAVTANFLSYRTLVASPLKTVILRALGFMGPQLNAYFKKRLIQSPMVLDDVKLKRTIKFDARANRLEIEDRIDGMTENDRLEVSPPVSPRLVPSARFFQQGDVAAFVRHSSATPFQVSRVLDLSDLKTQ